MKPFFSIIIPVLNEADYLPRLLTCLADQQYRMFEVIVVDGNSEDETVMKAKTFIHRLPHLEILHAHKRNVGHQRNKGAQHAQGIYLVFFDADVMVEMDFLEKMYGHLIDNKTLLCTTNLVADDPNMINNIIMFIANTGRDVLLFFKNPAAAGGYNITISKVFFETLKGFDRRFTYSEDMDLLMRAHKRGILIKNFHQPTLKYSFRRYKKFGYIHVLRLYIVTMIKLFFKKDPRHFNVSYPMDGKLYLNNKE
jgi:glycosyltransferase involved in cell wall biosynthesis